MKLIFSPDDGGYYWQRFSDWKTSQLFDTREEAIEFLSKDQIIWES